MAASDKTKTVNMKSGKRAKSLQHAHSDPNFLFSLSGNSQKWTKVETKRKRSPNQSQPLLKQARIENYWLGPQQLSNRFDSLEDNDKIEIDVVEKEPRPPPLVIDQVSRIAPLYAKLDEVAKDNYTLKVIGTERVRIQPTRKEDYSAIYKALEDNGSQFHTYEVKANRAFRVVLKNLHPSTDLKELKETLKLKGHEARNVHNITQRGTKMPLPLFFVDLEPKENNKDIFNIEYIMHQKITFEAPHTKREIPQCSKCQRYGHTKKFCHYQTRCVKCTNFHATADCPRKVRDREVVCVLCAGNHPANYKGCSVYRDLRDKAFPSLRNKGDETGNNTPTRRSSLVNPNKSYAQAAREEAQQAQFVHNVTQQSSQQSNDISELKQMMKELMTQMGTMLNLLTTLVNKIK